MDEATNSTHAEQCQHPSALPREILPLIAAGQRKLLRARRRRGLPDDPRSLQNLRVVEQKLKQKPA